MSEILDFWASRLPGGRHELDRNQVVDDVLGWGRSHGLKLHWLGPILGVTNVRFFTSKAFSVVRYTRKTLGLIGGDVEFPAECVTSEGRVNDACMESVLHELWHAYCQNFAEKNENDPAIARLYVMAMDGMRGQVADSAIAESADEAIGHYISAITECVKLHLPNATNAAMAQRLWNEVASEDRREFDLTGNEYPKINAVCRLPESVAHEVRARIFGLEDDVSAWAPESRTWEIKA